MKKALKVLTNTLYVLLVVAGVVIFGRDAIKTNDWVFIAGRIALTLGLGGTFILFLMSLFLQKIDPTLTDEKIYHREYYAISILFAILAITGAILELKPH
jgi:hypothetical protein